MQPQATKPFATLPPLAKSQSLPSKCTPPPPTWPLKAPLVIITIHASIKTLVGKGHPHHISSKKGKNEAKRYPQTMFQVAKECPSLWSCSCPFLNVNAVAKTPR
jgi:hypothetical protein